MLTANRRLTRWLETEFAKQKRSENRISWPRPAIYSLAGWYQQQWQKMQMQRLGDKSDFALLSPLQETCLWQQLFTSNNQGYELLNENDTAELARTAWQTLRLWCQHPQSLPDYNETVFLKQLITAFEQHCAQHALIDETDMMTAVVDAFVKALLPSPQKVILYGFQDFPPLTQNLFQTWQTHNCEFNELVFCHPHSAVQVQACLTENDEIERAASWAESILQKNEGETPPRIAIVVPDLTRLRPRIEQAFHQRFEPQYTLASQARHAPGFNISAGQMLCDTAPVAAAFYALELNNNEIEANTLSHILRSPYLADFSELDARAMLEIRLLKKQGRKIRRSRLYALCAEACGAIEEKEEGEAHTNESQEIKSELPLFYQALKSFQACSRGLEYQNLNCLEWSLLFQKQLDALAWPGTRTSNTLEYQQIQKWPDVLENFASLDLVLANKVGFPQALALLRLCARQAFQVQTLDSPIQILGLLEAAGLPFDYLRILQMDDQHWPQACEPNPFIPAALQRDLAMPRASYDGELRYAEKLCKHFSESAPEVTFSYAKTQEDRELLPSPLLNTFTQSKEGQEAHRPSQPEDDYFSLIAREKLRLQAFNDHCGSPLNLSETIPGGTQILKDQAACYFQAFAKHRLGIEDEEQNTLGIDARDRGILIHQSLDLFWRSVKSQQRLLTMSERDIENLIRDCVEQSRAGLARENETSKLLELESKRTVSLLLSWVAVEKQRRPFKVVQQEKIRKLRIDNLPLQIRADRVDELEDGSHFVIDYKTGSPELKAWAGERPDEPQIPLYAIANEKNVSAAAFAVLNAKNVAFKGIAKTPEHTPGLVAPESLTRLDLPDTWEEVLQQWHRQLEVLARAFLAGEADVNPKKNAETCRYCGLQSLCRVREIFDENSDSDVNMEFSGGDL